MIFLEFKYKDVINILPLEDTSSLVFLKMYKKLNETFFLNEWSNKYKMNSIFEIS